MARLICFGICLSSSVAAHAQDVADPKKEAEYQELINYALEEYDRGSWEEAAALFHRAHELAPSARTLRGLGLATYEARRYAESVRHLRAALADKRRPLTDKQREEVQHTLDRAKLFVGHVVVDLSPRDAQLTINGRVVEPEVDGGFMVDTGFVDLEANAPGYLPVSRRMRIGGGEQQRVVLRLASATPVAEAPAQRSAPTHLPEPAQVAVTTTPDRGAAHDSSFGPWKWVAGAGAVVALAAGGTMLAMQKAQAPAYERECNQAVTAAPDCDERHTYLSTTLWTGSIVGLSLGGALTALSVTLFVLDANKDDSSSQNHLVMACGGGPFGVACRGQF
ncbi:MAG TPA: tetratricopeptide repeat protein [Polyangiales bacterium]|nr:tetratricopeptide repeat protein [Polyangiales bacterium]